MKKVTLSLMIMILSLSISSTTMMAKTSDPTNLAPANTEVPAEVKVMYERLKEIKNMDKSDLTSSDRKELRKEVRAIKSNLRASGNGGVYLSIGAIIIIILILILIL